MIRSFNEIYDMLIADWSKIMLLNQINKLNQFDQIVKILWSTHESIDDKYVDCNNFDEILIVNLNYVIYGKLYSLLKEQGKIELHDVDKNYLMQCFHNKLYELITSSDNCPLIDIKIITDYLAQEEVISPMQ